jgi:serine phosphatase RsbU (regulator of sigma subunit)
MLPIRHLIIPFLMLLMTAFPVMTQNQESADSLWKETEKAKHDTVKIRLYNDIAWLLMYSVPDSSIRILNRACQLADKNRFHHGRIYCLYGLSRAYWVKSDFPTSMRYALDGMALCDSTANRTEKIKYLNMLGLIYYEMSYHDKAIDMFNSAHHLSLNTGDSSMLSRILGNLGDLYFNDSDTAKAYHYYIQALEISKSRNDDINSSTNYLAIGQIYREQGRYSLAEEYLTEGLRLAEKVHDKQNISQCLSALAVLYKKTGNTSKYREYSEKALDVAQSVGDLASVYESAFILYEFYREKEDFREALRYYLIADAADDSMFNSYQNDELNRLQHSFEITKRQATIEILSKDKELAELRSVLFASGSALFLLLGIVIFRSRQKARRANSLLEKQKKEIETQRDEISAQRDIVTQQKQHIEKIYTSLTDSIHYAEKIQTAVLPDFNSLKEKIPYDFFVLYEPRDIVSGDFFYVEKRKNNLLIAVADCTGHGVPGALMSMLGVAFLNEIISKEEVQSPAVVLEEMRKKIVHSLQQKSSENDSAYSLSAIKDGMDMSFIQLNTQTLELQFAGANNPLYIIKSAIGHWLLAVGPNITEANSQQPMANSQLIELKGDKMPVGIHSFTQPFTNHTIQLQKGDTVYLMTDGFADQFGGKEGRKFMAKNLKKLLTDISGEQMEKQRTLLSESFTKWKQNDENRHDQTDDMTFFGFRV